MLVCLLMTITSYRIIILDYSQVYSSGRIIATLFLIWKGNSFFSNLSQLQVLASQLNWYKWRLCWAITPSPVNVGRAKPPWKTVLGILFGTLGYWSSHTVPWYLLGTVRKKGHLIIFSTKIKNSHGSISRLITFFTL